MHRAVPALVVALCALAPAAVSAEPDPADAYKYRHELFETLGAQMMSLSMIVKGKAGSVEDLNGHAVILHELAQIVPNAFPKGSGPKNVPQTRALPGVWANEAGFTAAADALIDASADLVKLTKKKSPDLKAVGAQLGQVGAACGGCHEQFRGPEPEEEAHEEHHE